MTERFSGRWARTGESLQVTVRGGLVESVETGPAFGGPDVYLSPGLVDLQVNGYAGFDFNVGDPDQVIGAVAALRRRGTLTVVPTVITGSPAHMVACLRAVMVARRDPMVAGAVGAVHLEGPFLSPVEQARGAHDVDHIRPPDLAELDRWLDVCAPLPVLVTVAPETPGATAFIVGAVARGVTVSLGHTVADAAQIAAAVGAGATLSTHLGNGVPLELPRHPNLIWAQLAERRLRAGLIADGFHLDGATLRAMIAAKGPGRAFLVSDAVALAGRPPGRYTTPVGGQVELDPGGRLRIAGRQHLAGAAVDLAVGVARVPALTGLSLRRAITLATRVPGRILSAAGTTGRGRAPRPGAPADLVQFRWAPGDDDLEVLTVG